MSIVVSFAFHPRIERDPVNFAHRAHVRFDDSTLKLVAGAGTGAPSSANGINIHTSDNVGIGKVNPGSKLDVLSSTTTAIVGKSTSSSGAGVYGESECFLRRL